MSDNDDQRQNMANLAKQYLDMWQAQLNQGPPNTSTNASEGTQAWQQFTKNFQQMQQAYAQSFAGGATDEAGTDTSSGGGESDDADLSAHGNGGLSGEPSAEQWQQLLQRLAWLEQRVASLEAKLANNT